MRSAEDPMAFGGLVTLLNLVLCLIVGIRLLRVGFGRDRGPELALAIFLLASSFVSTICQGLVYGSLVDPSIALPDRASRIVLGLGVRREDPSRPTGPTHRRPSSSRSPRSSPCTEAASLRIRRTRSTAPSPGTTFATP